MAKGTDNGEGKCDWLTNPTTIEPQYWKTQSILEEKDGWIFLLAHIIHSNIPSVTAECQMTCHADKIQAGYDSCAFMN